MARNRKNQAASIRFAPAMWALLLCLLIGGAGVGYVWLKGQIHDLGQQILTRERKLAEAKDRNEKLRGSLAELRSPLRLKARVRELNLGLGPPQPSQVVRIAESPGPAPVIVPGPGQQVAAQPARPSALPERPD
jgi:hypothetical protein